MSELTYAISFRRSSATGINNISPLILQNLPLNALEVLLCIFQHLPSSWSYFHVISIFKPNSTSSFRPIALSSALCKMFEHMLKSCLDWWLESMSILSNSLFTFKNGKDILECLPVFSVHILLFLK